MILDNNIDTVRTELIVGIIGKDEFTRLLENNLIQDINDIALISIHDPDVTLHSEETLEGFADRLQMQFWDVESDLNMPKYPPISFEQGVTIRNFIEKNVNKRFLVHCAAGMSRSAGVGLAIECIIEHDGNKYFHQTSKSAIRSHTTDRYCPNLTVYDRVLG